MTTEKQVTSSSKKVVPAIVEAMKAMSELEFVVISPDDLIRYPELNKLDTFEQVDFMRNIGRTQTVALTNHKITE